MGPHFTPGIPVLLKVHNLLPFITSMCSYSQKRSLAPLFMNNTQQPVLHKTQPSVWLKCKQVMRGIKYVCVNHKTWKCIESWRRFAWHWNIKRKIHFLLYSFQSLWLLRVHHPSFMFPVWCRIRGPVTSAFSNGPDKLFLLIKITLWCFNNALSSCYWRNG